MGSDTNIAVQSLSALLYTEILLPYNELKYRLVYI